ncbi:MAG: SDR family NAD(P)-dependent oxidoreductase, partial [Myxococcota bacterium]
MGEFEGRTIFITGASLGVGKACAQQFHRLGANVVLNARRVEPLEAAAA